MCSTWPFRPIQWRRVSVSLWPSAQTPEGRGEEETVYSSNLVFNYFKSVLSICIKYSCFFFSFHFNEQLFYKDSSQYVYKVSFQIVKAYGKHLEKKRYQSLVYFCLLEARNLDTLNYLSKMSYRKREKRTIGLLTVLSWGAEYDDVLGFKVRVHSLFLTLIQHFFFILFKGLHYLCHR